jgi:hypothetical protein
LSGVSYEWNEFINSVRDGYEIDRPVLGFIAQELEKHFPELVDIWELNDEIKDARAVDYPRLTAVLVEAIKDLNTIIESQQAQISNLQKQIDEIKLLINK